MEIALFKQKQTILVIISFARIVGNTEKLADTFIQGVKEKGREVIRIHLGEIAVNPCKGCNPCVGRASCVQKDNMHSIYEALKICDTVVLASSLYALGKRI